MRSIQYVTLEQNKFASYAFIYLFIIFYLFIFFLSIFFFLDRFSKLQKRCFLIDFPNYKSVVFSCIVKINK